MRSALRVALEAAVELVLTLLRLRRRWSFAGRLRFVRRRLFTSLGVDSSAAVLPCMTRFPILADFPASASACEMASWPAAVIW